MDGADLDNTDLNVANLNNTELTTAIVAGDAKADSIFISRHLFFCLEYLPPLSEKRGRGLRVSPRCFRHHLATGVIPSEEAVDRPNGNFHWLSRDIILGLLPVGRKKIG